MLKWYEETANKKTWRMDGWFDGWRTRLNHGPTNTASSSFSPEEEDGSGGVGLIVQRRGREVGRSPVTGTTGGSLVVVAVVTHWTLPTVVRARVSGAAVDAAAGAVVITTTSVVGHTNSPAGSLHKHRSADPTENQATQ